LLKRRSNEQLAFGRLFIANPDLPKRIKEKIPFNELKGIGWYGGGKEGYTDYPLSNQ
jgi:N-ethylmaleimide reductase